MNVQRATLNRVWSLGSGKGRHSYRGRILLSLMTLVWTVSTANSISVDLTPGGENGTVYPPPTMMSYHGGMEQMMTQVITFGAI